MAFAKPRQITPIKFIEKPQPTKQQKQVKQLPVSQITVQQFERKKKQIELFKKQNQKKTTDILIYLKHRVDFNKAIQKEQDPKKLKKMFSQYRAWKDFAKQIEKQDKETFKLIKQQHRIYYGQILNHKKSGYGISVYEDGRMFEGLYLNNQKQGQGIQSYPNGNVYNGNFEHNKKHGNGQMFWFSLKGQNVDQFYFGDWWGGLPFGSGKHQRSNGDYYQGQFKNGLKHGLGWEIFANGKQYKGQYVNGLPEGQGYFRSTDGSTYVGQFKQGVKSGYGKQFNKQNLQQYEGDYLSNLRCGFGTLLDSKGRVYSGQFMDDCFHGYGQIKLNQQTLYKGQWQKGKPLQTSTINSSYNPQQSSVQLSRYRSDNKIKKLNKSSTKTLNTSLSKQYISPTRKYQSASRRVGTEAAILTSVKQTSKLKRPLSLNKLIVKSKLSYPNKNQDKPCMNLCGRKFGHKNCIPLFPWQQRGQRVLLKLKSQFK